MCVNFAKCRNPCLRGVYDILTRQGAYRPKWFNYHLPRQRLLDDLPRWNVSCSSPLENIMIFLFSPPTFRTLFYRWNCTFIGLPVSCLSSRAELSCTNNKAGAVFILLLLYIQKLTRCLQHSKCSINVSWRNEQMNEWVNKGKRSLAGESLLGQENMS